MGVSPPINMPDLLFVCLLYFTSFFTAHMCKTNFNMLSVSESQDERRRRNKLYLLETKLSNFLFPFFFSKLCKQMFLFLQGFFFFSELFYFKVLYFKVNKKPLRYF